MNKILFIFEYATMRGGAPQTDFSLIRGLLQRGWEISVLVRKETEAERILRTLPGIKLLPVNELTISLSSPIKTLRSLCCVRRELRSRVKSHWIVTDGSVGRVLMSLLFWMRPKECFISRGGDYNTHTGIFIRSFFPLLKKIVAITPSQKRRLLAAGAKENQIKVIYDGLPPPNTSIEKKITTTLRISTLGFVSKLKNQEIGIKITNELRKRGIDAVFQIYGSEYSHGIDALYATYLRKLVVEFDLSSYVIFKGFNSNIDEIFSETDILVSSSWSEGFGRTIVEAMFRKCPVIAYAGAGGPSDLIVDRRTGFLVSENVAEKYIESVLEIIGNPCKTNEITENAYKFATKNFSEAQMVEKFCNFLIKDPYEN